MLGLSPNQSRFWGRQSLVESENLLHCFEHRDLLHIVLEKMRSKVTELISIIYTDLE